MWDNPRLLNAVAGFLVGMAALAFGAASLYWLAHSPLFPLRTVELRSALAQAPQAEVEAAMARFGTGNFFAAPIDELRVALERVPWVRKAAVRRVWPGRLEVTIEEHVALARWGAGGLVNTHGERFAGATDAALPLFAGPPGSEAEIARHYESFARIVAPLGSSVERVGLSERRAWQLTLANGLELVLGRDSRLAEERLARFVAVYGGIPGARALGRDLVDLRYPNGFTVQVRG
jgi:cell division protein FtsQ